MVLLPLGPAPLGRTRTVPQLVCVCVLCCECVCVCVHVCVLCVCVCLCVRVCVCVCVSRVPCVGGRCAHARVAWSYMCCLVGCMFVPMRELLRMMWDLACFFLGVAAR